jgi:hypothetical protein
MFVRLNVRPRDRSAVSGTESQLAGHGRLRAGDGQPPARPSLVTQAARMRLIDSPGRKGPKRSGFRRSNQVF